MNTCIDAPKAAGFRSHKFPSTSLCARAATCASVSKRCARGLKASSSCPVPSELAASAYDELFHGVSKCACSHGDRFVQAQGHDVHDPLLQDHSDAVHTCNACSR